MNPILLLTLVIVIILISFISSIVSQNLPIYQEGQKSCQVTNVTADGHECKNTNELLAFVIYREKINFQIAQLSRDNAYNSILFAPINLVTSLWDTIYGAFVQNVDVNGCRAKCWEHRNCIGFRSYFVKVFFFIKQWKCSLIGKIAYNNEKKEEILSGNDEQVHILSCCQELLTTPEPTITTPDTVTSSEEISKEQIEESTTTRMVKRPFVTVQLMSAQAKEKETNYAWVYFVVILLVTLSIGAAIFVYLKRDTLFRH